MVEIDLRHFYVVEAKIVSPTTGERTIEECHKGRTSRKLVKTGHAVANVELDVAMHSSVNRSTHISHIIIFPLAKAFAAGNVKRIWSATIVLAVLYYAININLINCI